MEVKLYKCAASLEPNIKDNLLKAGAVFPDIFFDSDKLVKAVTDAFPNLDDAVITLPMCNTLMAEAFGAEVDYGNESMDPFVKSYKFDSVADFPTDVTELSSERIDVMLKAASKLSDMGYRVSFNLDGPITIIGSVVDPMALFKSFRKAPDALEKAMDYVSDMIIEFGRRVTDSGISILSYSDSSGTMDLIGPKLFDKFCIEPNLRILKALKEDVKDKKAIVHICGKSTFGLYKAGKIALVPHSTDMRTYKDAIFDVIDNKKFEILGNSCLGKLNLKPFNAQIFEVEIVE